MRSRALQHALTYPSFDSKEEIFGSEFPDTTDPVAALRQVRERYV